MKYLLIATYKTGAWLFGCVIFLMMNLLRFVWDFHYWRNRKELEEWFIALPTDDKVDAFKTIVLIAMLGIFITMTYNLPA